MRFAMVTVGMTFFLSGWLAAQDSAPIEVELRPRAIESPELKYRLLPAEMELKPGNAAPILLRLPWEQMPWMNKVYPTLSEWESRPLRAPEWESSAGVLPETFYQEMKRAAYRRDAGWEYPIGETQSPYLILLPDVQGLRAFLCLGLSAKIRYHLSRGELDKAREGILVGMANGRHLAQTPFFVNQLVAQRIHWTMLDRTVELIAQPHSPNLYWALSTLPDSLLELDRAASLEGTIFAMTLPAVNDLDRPRSAQEWSKMARQLVEFLEGTGEIPKQNLPKQDSQKISMLAYLLQQLTAAEQSQLSAVIAQARADLPAMLKISAEKVAAMSDDEAGVRWYAHMRLSREHRTAAILSLPPREAWPQLKKLQLEIKLMDQKTRSKERDAFNPTSVYVSFWSLKRKIQALRIMEAVRHHLATHDGKLPLTLDEITDVPIPLDALTDQPFQWKVEGKIATLKAPTIPADVIEPGSATDRATSLEYRLRVE